jgi:hypothetical protein
LILSTWFTEIQSIYFELDGFELLKIDCIYDGYIDNLFEDRFERILIKDNSIISGFFVVLLVIALVLVLELDLAWPPISGPISKSISG